MTVQENTAGTEADVNDEKAASLLYMGQASIRIVTAENKVIYIDPYAGDWYDLPADLILVTHAHFDHSQISKVENRASDCMIITQDEALENGEHQVSDLGYVTVEAVEAGYNDWHDTTDSVGYVLTFILIARSGRKKVNYSKIVIPLIVYISAKFGYGFVMKAAEEYISSTLTLFFALIILAMVLIPSAKPLSIAVGSPEGKKGVFIVILCKLPNALGLLGENAVAAESLTNYSFIQPMILIVVLALDLVRKNTRPTGSNLAGSALCVIGILGFQAVDHWLNYLTI